MSERAKWLFGMGLIAGMCLAGCGGDGTTLGSDGTPASDGDEPGEGGEPATRITLAQLSEEIFTPRCAKSGCHGGGSTSGGLSLEVDDIAGEIIDVSSTQNTGLKRIEPGNPEDSYLLRKVEGRDIVASQMPADGTVLSAAQIDRIRAWIEAGASTE